MSDEMKSEKLKVIYVSFGSVMGMIAFATVATLWTYEGWTNLNPVAEEMRNPGRDLPRAILSGSVE